jgi:acetyltransferase
MTQSREANPLHAIFNARSVAFVGASNKPTTMGTIQMLNTLRGNFKGPVIPVHPKLDRVLGEKAYPTLRALPEPVDLAVLVVPTDAVLPVVEDAAARGIRHLVITSAGFREGGEEGRQREERLRELSRRHGIRFVGPNCIGVLNTASGLNTTFFPYLHTPGPLGLASQSGTYVTQVLDLLSRWGIGLSKAISVGNSVSIDLADCLDFFADDPDTRAVALYVEGIPDGRKFLSAARRCTARKPVVALYVGGTEGGARSGRSHTGAMGGPDEIYNGLFAQAGIQRVSTVADLYTFGWALATQAVPRGNRMVILTHSGGPATSMADAVYRHKMTLSRFSPDLEARIREMLPATASASNPIDLTFSLDIKLLQEKLPPLLLGQDNVDGLLMHGLQGSTFFSDISRIAGDLFSLPLDQMSEFARLAVEPLCRMPEQFQKPIVMSCFYDRRDNVVRTLQDSLIPVFDTPERAVAAMGALVRYGEYRRRLVQPGNSDARAVV